MANANKPNVPNTSSLAASVIKYSGDTPTRHVRLDDAIKAAPPGFAGGLRILAGKPTSGEKAGGTGEK